MDEQKGTIRRQIAYKVKIKNILEGRYVKNEGGWMPNYIELGEFKVSRVNLIGIVVQKPIEPNTNQQSIVIDDGTGKIPIKSFEESSMFDKTRIGDAVLIIGRPREFGAEKYIVPEIIKKLDNIEWIRLRQLELNSAVPAFKEAVYTDNNIRKDDILKEEIIEDAIEGPSDKVYKLIKENDKGNGSDFDGIVSLSKEKGTEKIIKRLLEQGDIFEVKPGKLKVLE